MAKVLLSELNSRDAELKLNIQIYNTTTDTQVKTEIIHAVYDLGFDELAEAMTDAIYGQTNNLRFLLGDYEVTDRVNTVNTSQSWLKSALSFFSFNF